MHKHGTILNTIYSKQSFFPLLTRDENVVETNIVDQIRKNVKFSMWRFRISTLLHLLDRYYIVYIWIFEVYLRDIIENIRC